MRTQNNGYIITKHFSSQQVTRQIDSLLLVSILLDVKCTDCEKDVIIIMPSYLKRKRADYSSNKNCLVIVSKKNVLITCYWCDHPNYLFNSEKQSHFQILY